jgi:hypothetical protein
MMSLRRARLRLACSGPLAALLFDKLKDLVLLLSAAGHEQTQCVEWLRAQCSNPNYLGHNHHRRIPASQLEETAICRVPVPLAGRLDGQL